MLLRRAGLTLLAVLLCSTPALAHYLWVSAESKPGEHGVTNVYFEEGPRVGDGFYLDPFIERGTTWIRTAAAPQPREIEMQEKKEGDKQRWLQGELPAAAPRSIDSYGKWGVYRYGDTDVLLHYYARLLDVTKQSDLEKLARAEQMKLDIVPSTTASGMELQVLWQDKPAAGAPVYLRGPKNLKETLKTDENGKAQFQLSGPGQYLLRTYVEEPEGGKDDGKEYQKIRHNGTVVMKLPLK